MYNNNFGTVCAMVKLLPFLSFALRLRWIKCQQIKQCQQQEQHRHNAGRKSGQTKSQSKPNSNRHIHRHKGGNRIYLKSYGDEMQTNASIAYHIVTEPKKKHCNSIRSHNVSHSLSFGAMCTRSVSNKLETKICTVRTYTFKRPLKRSRVMFN